MFQSVLIKPGDRKLRVEALERRCLLSGNVAAAVNSHGDLVITGDLSANGVQLTETATDYVVTGLTTTGPTTINTFASRSFAIGRVTHDIIVNMKWGDDVVQVGDGLTTVEAKHDLLVDMGSLGNKQLVVDWVNVDHSAYFKSGSGQDAVDLKNLFISGNLALETRGGNKMIAISNTVVGGGAGIVTGSGDHLIGMVNFFLGGQLIVQTGNGNNVILATLDNTTLSGTAGPPPMTGAVADFANGHTFFTTTAYANASSLEADLQSAAAGATFSFAALDASFQTGGWVWGSGNDFIDIANAMVAGDLRVDAGNGLNVIGISSTTVGGDASISTGSQDDLVALLALDVTNQLTVETGSGNDMVGASRSAVDAAFTDYAHSPNDKALLQAEFDATNAAIPLGDPSFNAHIVVFRTGSGDDHVYLSEFNNALAQLTVSLGAGNNDKLVFNLNTFAAALLDGGPGNNDTLDTTGNSNTGTLTIQNFEVVI
jgi:hypothetical protein